MRGRDLARIDRDLAARRVATPAEAAARAHRGRALVQAALEGHPSPADSVVGAAAALVAYRDEYVACGRCYAPTLGVPGALCQRCAPAAQSLDEVVGVPPDPPP